jgi:CubicO group peptidase (beta-lactamase class C family)
MGWARGGALPPKRARILSTILVAGLGFFFAADASRAEPSQLASLAPQNTLTTLVPQTAAVSVVWPTKSWSISTPEAQGIDSRALARALEQIRVRHIAIHSLLIERHGRIVLDTYFYPFSDNRPHNVYSVTKSVTSMLVGIAVAEHRLADLNAPVLSLLPLRTDDPRKEHITLANLLSMTSGLDCRPASGESLLQQMLRSRHLAAFMMSRPTDAEPGTTFDYCGGNTEVISAVLTRTIGASAFEYARERLLAPLGITNASWPTDADNVSHGWGDLELQPRDMAKLGYLWLHNGRWENKQVVPADYLVQALSRHINVQPGIDYGYGMWLYPGHTPVDFEANGSFGQRITVIPSLDTVEVMTGGGFDANVVAELIASAIKCNTGLPADTDSDLRLATLSYQAALPAGSLGMASTLASTPRPKPNPFSRATPLLSAAAPSEADLRTVVYPRPKPNVAAVASEAIPVPRPKPVLRTPALVALRNVPGNRSKPAPASQLEAAIVGVAEEPTAAATVRPLH